MREVRVIRDAAGLAALAPEWDELLARSASDTVFLTWAWLASWWDTYGDGLEPRVATVREDGRLVAAAPCKIEERRRYGLSFRQLEFIGTGRAVCPDFLDLVIERGREDELVPPLVAALAAERGWDKLAFTDIPADSPVRRGNAPQVREQARELQGSKRRLGSAWAAATRGKKRWARAPALHDLL